MMKSFFVGFFIVIMCLTNGAWAQKVKIPRLRTVGGSMKHLVLAQTEPEMVEKKSGFTVLRKYYIARWGVHRYEYGMVQYQCRVSRCELLGESVPLKFYKECWGFKKNGQVNCRGLESARVDVTDPYNSDDMEGKGRRHWYTCEDYGMPCSEQDDLNEYPSRYSPEDPDLPTGI